MLVKFKRLSDKAVMPKYAKSGDAGLDLTATKVIFEDSQQIVYGTDIAMELPKNGVGKIYPRSSIRKYDLTLSNSVGIIDSGYRGEIQFTFNKKRLDLVDKLVSSPNYYEIGDRIGQLVIVELPKVVIQEEVELSDSERGEGGHGSTGK